MYIYIYHIHIRLLLEHAKKLRTVLVSIVSTEVDTPRGPCHRKWYRSPQGKQNIQLMLIWCWYGLIWIELDWYGFVWKCWVYSQWNSHLKTIIWSLTIGYNGVHYFQTHPYGQSMSISGHDICHLVVLVVCFRAFKAWVRPIRPRTQAHMVSYAACSLSHADIQKLSFHQRTKQW